MTILVKYYSLGNILLLYLTVWWYPRPVLQCYFLSGCLPGEAVIHLKILSLFGMVARLQDDPLRIHARNILVTAKPSSKSWFCQVRDICLKYELPHPLQILEYTPNKESFKKLVKSKIINFWESKLRGEASILPSLQHFHPEYMSLCKTHPIWSTAGSNPHEISKAVQQARFVSGRYRSWNITRQGSEESEGFCLSPTCTEQVETVEHVLVECGAYNLCKARLYSLWLSTPNKAALRLVLEALSSETSYLLQFILDCSVLPSVRSAVEINGPQLLKDLFYLTRSWCFSVHRQRMKMLGRWNFQ